VTINHSPIPAAVPDVPNGPVSSEEQAAFAVSRTDLVLGGRAVISSEYLSGLILAAELDTAGAPRKLPADLFPGVDPVVVQEVWDRALVVGVRCGRLMGAPRLHRDVLARLRGELLEAGHVAMAGMVGRAAATAFAVHPADGESEGRGHGEG
jgi:hypothetical protein